MTLKYLWCATKIYEVNGVLNMFRNNLAFIGLTLTAVGICIVCFVCVLTIENYDHSAWNVV